MQNFKSLFSIEMTTQVLEHQTFFLKKSIFFVGNHVSCSDIEPALVHQISTAG